MIRVIVLVKNSANFAFDLRVKKAILATINLLNTGSTKFKKVWAMQFYFPHWHTMQRKGFLENP